MTTKFGWCIDNLHHRCHSPVPARFDDPPDRRAGRDHMRMPMPPRPPERVQRKRAKGWRMPEGAVYVGRPSKWGNPFRLVSANRIHDPYGNEWDCAQGEARGVAVRLFREYMWDHFDGEALVKALAGKDLACWCPLDQPCHADVLLEIANRCAHEPIDRPESDSRVCGVCGEEVSGA